MLNKILEILNNKFGNLDIVSIYKTGSQLICDICNDYDYKVIVKELDKDVKSCYDVDTKLNLIIYKEDYYNKLCEFEIVDRHTAYIIDNVFKPNNTIYGDNSFNLKLLENADKFKAFARDKMRMILDKHYSWKGKGQCCNKHYWWYILTLMMIENNSYEITEQMLDIANKCHNGELSNYWEEWVKEKLK